MYYDPFTVELFINKILKRRLLQSFPGSYFINNNEELNSHPILGKYYGYYENNSNGDERINFYEEGIIFNEKTDIHIKYSDIVEIALENGKHSLALILILKSGEAVRLPTKHINGKFMSVFVVDAFLREAAFNVRR